MDSLNDLMAILSDDDGDDIVYDDEEDDDARNDDDDDSSDSDEVKILPVSIEYASEPDGSPAAVRANDLPSTSSVQTDPLTGGASTAAPPASGRTVRPLIGPLLPVTYVVDGSFVTMRQGGTATPVISCPGPKLMAPADPDVVTTRLHMSRMDSLRRRADDFSTRRLKKEETARLASNDKDNAARRVELSSLGRVLRVHIDDYHQMVNEYSVVRGDCRKALDQLSRLTDALDALAGRYRRLRELEEERDRLQRERDGSS